MAKSRKLEELTSALKQIRDDPTTTDGQTVLRRVLHSKQGVAIAQAARLVGQLELQDRVPDLVIAFEQLLQKPQTTDPGCVGKQAIAETLYRLDYRDAALFLTGIHHIQPEPVWGGQTDTAPKLRGTCALGLVRMNYPAVMIELADLLADPEPEARVGAARAIAYSGTDQGVPLLRLRIKLGDTPPLLSEYFVALLKLAPSSSLSLVQDYLYARDRLGLGEATEIAEAVALALSESDHPEAFSLLRDWWQHVRDPGLRKTALLTIATLRSDAALEFLLNLITAAARPDAQDALKALSIYRQDPILWSQVQQRVKERPELER